MKKRMVIRWADVEQPWEVTYAPPNWPKVDKDKLKEKQREAFAKWIEQQDYPPHDDLPDYPVATDEILEAYIESLPEITEAERNAVVRGSERKQLGRDDAWTDLVACVRAPNPSPHFLSVVADLIEGGVLHNRGAVKPGTITTAEAKRRHARYVGILQRVYPGKDDDRYEERAYDIIATEVQRSDETYEKARTRVENARKRPLATTEEPAIDRAVKRILASRIRFSAHP